MTNFFEKAATVKGNSFIVEKIDAGFLAKDGLGLCCSVFGDSETVAARKFINTNSETQWSYYFANDKLNKIS